MPLVPEALTALACAEDPTVAREALKAARRALGEEADTDTADTPQETPTQ